MQNTKENWKKKTLFTTTPFTFSIQGTVCYFAKLHNHCATFFRRPIISYCNSLWNHLQLLFFFFFFTYDANYKSLEGYKNKVIKHFHRVNIDLLLMNTFRTLKSSLFAAGRNPMRCIDTESLFNDLESGRKGEKGFQHFLKHRDPISNTFRREFSFPVA